MKRGWRLLPLLQAVLGRRVDTGVGERGNVALIFALILPGLLVTGLGAVQLNQVLADRKRTQDVADSAALMGASQLGVSPVGAASRAQGFAQAQLADMAANATVNVAAAVQADGSLKVSIDTQRPSFFGNSLPAGGFHTHAEATAKGANTIPLCVLGIAPASKDLVHVTGNSQLQAGQCMVHSNQALTVDPAAVLQASANEAGTTATGSITATPGLLAPNIPDPFSGLNVDPSSCSGANTDNLSNNTLSAGIHVANISVSSGSALTLAPGEHYFCKGLTIASSSSVTGTDVVLIFDQGAQLTFDKSASTVNLSGRQSGPLAGFVLIADRSYTGTFTLQSDDITNLTGTVYVPTATLSVQGTAKSGATSPWTVIAAKTLTVDKGVQLVINANYAASNVPVPIGVGNQRTNIKLLQ